MLRNGIATKTKKFYKEKRSTCNKNFMVALIKILFRMDSYFIKNLYIVKEDHSLQVPHFKSLNQK